MKMTELFSYIHLPDTRAQVQSVKTKL